ncbi:MAG: hypothetical protein MJ090_01340 [Clostridia bacterium]|nr:hypothetical protein [Clostridia bacterium]
MDNLKYYNDSLAYDFSMFMPRNEKSKNTDNIVKLPKAKVRPRQKAAAKRVSMSAFAVMTAVFVLAALCGNIFLRLQINEVNSKINETKTKIEELESEKTSLEVEFERRISYANIELEATEMGMQKKDKSQVKYIRINNNNTASTDNGKTVVSKDY